MSDEFITLSELHRLKLIPCAESLPTVRRRVLLDLETNNYLKTVVIKRKGTGTRYYIPVKNIDTFVKAFHDNKIFTKETN